MTGETTEDRVLVRAAQAGDREAFGLLVARHAPSILSLATRMLGPTADADDVAQETFVSAYRSLSRFQGDSKFSTWLYRIAVNKCTDAMRARRPDISLDATTDDSSIAWETASDETPYWALERSELAAALDRSIQALPHVYRESFVLRHIEGLDYDEMSTVLGVNRDTLKMRVYKARQQLCDSLEHLRAGKTGNGVMG